MTNNISAIKEQILSALGHPEAVDGLFLRNFRYVHQEDERPIVDAEQKDFLRALNALVGEGKIIMEESCEEIVFRLAGQDLCSSSSGAV